MVNSWNSPLSVDGAVVSKRSLDDSVEHLMSLANGKRILILAPIFEAKASVLREELPNFERRGFQRVRIEGEIKRLDDRNLIPEKTKGRLLKVDLIVDRLRSDQSSRSRIADSLELAFKEGEENAFCLIEKEEGGFEETHFSQSYSCLKCGKSYPNLTSRHFSWNHPDGACETCGGLGQVLSFREDLVIPDHSLSLSKEQSNLGDWVLEK